MCLFCVCILGHNVKMLKLQDFYFSNRGNPFRQRATDLRVQSVLNNLLSTLPHPCLFFKSRNRLTSPYKVYDLKRCSFKSYLVYH